MKKKSKKHTKKDRKMNNQIADFTEQAERGDAKAQFMLGVMYANEDDYRKALHWYEKAAVQGFAEAQCHLGMLYADGIGIPQDYEKARYWLEQAADQGEKDIDGLMQLATLYYWGDGVPRSRKKALKWFEVAAAQGNVWAMVHCGNLYADGLDGVPHSLEMAEHWYKQAAAGGSYKAKSLLRKLNPRSDAA